MASLFNDIKRYFKADYQGRYFELILLELAKFEPETFCRIFEIEKRFIPSDSNSLRFVAEWRFRHEDKNPEADLALLDGDYPILLIEIKEDDVSNPKNLEQLERYISYARSQRMPGSPVKLAYVSRYPLGNLLSDVIEKNSDLVYEVGYRKILDGLRGGCGPVGDLVADYLRDIGVAAYRQINMRDSKEGKALTYMVAKMLRLPHSHRLGKLNSDATITAIPELLEKIFGNLEVFGSRIRTSNRDTFRKAFTRGFLSCPQYDHKAMKRVVDGKSDELGDAPGGVVYFFTKGTLDRKVTGVWADIECGYALSLKSGQKTRLVSIDLYACLNWPGKGNSVYAEKRVSNFHAKESDSFKALQKCFEEAKEEGKATSAPRELKKAWRTLTLPAA